jgi:hypothetical protein
LFFRLSSLELALILFGVVAGATLLGLFAGRYCGAQGRTWRAARRPVPLALVG